MPPDADAVKATCRHLDDASRSLRRAADAGATTVALERVEAILVTASRTERLRHYVEDDAARPPRRPRFP